MTEEERESDPRVIAFYQTIPKWVIDNRTYKNWLYNTKQFERLKSFKKEQADYRHKLNQMPADFWRTLKRIGFDLKQERKERRRQK